MSAVVYLVRHATPDWSRVGLRYDVPPGPPLTTQGEEEAIRLGDYLKEKQVAAIIASPLDRTLRTAELAGQQAALTFTVDDAVAEWRQGEPEAGVLARFLPRVAGAFVESRDNGPVALITHGGPIRLLLQHFGLPQAEVDFYRRQFDRDNPVPPSGVWRIAQAAGGQLEVPELVYTPQPFRRFVAEVSYV
jgi:probable phosphoglycerate mutase